MKRRKIAFIHNPHWPDSARLDTMPFALNSVIALENAGWEVDVYLWEKKSSIYSNLLSKNVKILYYSDSEYRRLNKLKYIWIPFQFQFKRQSSYDCVFGLGQAGAYIGLRIASSSRCPFVYLNDEFPSIWPNSVWSEIERQVASKATIIIVPDKHRFYPLCQELSINSLKAHAVLPNIPLGQSVVQEINWHKRLKLPEGAIPFLHAGSVADWAQVPELLSSVPYWPEKAVLIIHGRSPEETETTRKHLSHLDIPNKVFWSSESLTVDHLNSLVSYCTANFALYRNIGPNIEYTGFSSGKLMRSLKYGSPVIASKLSSLSFVTEHNLGFLVEHPAEIPNAVKQIMQDRVGYRNRCINFCDAHASFEKHWEIFCEQLRQITKVDLSKYIETIDIPFWKRHPYFNPIKGEGL